MLLNIVTHNISTLSAGDLDDLTKIVDYQFVPLQYPNSLNDADICVPSLISEDVNSFSFSDNGGSELDGTEDSDTRGEDTTPPALDGAIYHCPLKRHESEGHLDLAYNTDSGSNS